MTQSKELKPLDELHKFAIDFFDKQISSANTIDARYGDLWSALRQQFIGGGKRLRPRLILSILESYDLSIEDDHIRIALAHELLHTSLLLHDDIIDKDFERHGNLNVYGYYSEKYKSVDNTGAHEHYGMSAALLAGDLLIAAAYQIIAKCDINETTKSICVTLLSKGIFEVAGGELMDVEASFYPLGSYNPQKINRYKTSGYSFIVPILTGAALAALNRAEHSKLEAFAIKLGKVFQLQDDYLGVFGDEDLTGKSTNSDIAEAKYTALIVMHLDSLSDRDKNIFLKEFTIKDKSSKTIESIKRQLEDSGAREKFEKHIATLCGELKEMLYNLDLPNTTPLLSIIDKIIGRNT
jgi:geranylgeranyl diphosphate synthase, type II